MQTKPRRLTSWFLAVIMILTSTINFTLPTYAASVGGMHNNNLVYGPSDGYVNLSGMDANKNEAVPSYQMVRISLIGVGTDVDNPDGKIYTQGGIVNNPITVRNSNSAGVTYDNSCLGSVDRIRQLVNPDRYVADSTNAGTQMNTRRDYLDTSASRALLAYGSYKVGDHYELDMSGGEHFQSSYIDVSEDDSIPELIGSGSVKSKYQTNPPSGFENWKTMSNQEFFDSYTKAKFLSDEARAAGVTESVPDFIVRMLAIMLNKHDTPYASEVIQYYKDNIVTGKALLLVEPLQVFKNTGENSVVGTLFGSGCQYIALSSCEVAEIDDSCSGILYGYTNQASFRQNSTSSGGNNYNLFSGEGSPTQQACNDLFNSLLLSKTEWKLGLKSQFDEGATHENRGLKALMDKYVTSGENFMKGNVKTEDYGKAVDGSAKVGDSATSSFNSIFYYQIYKDVFGDTNYDAEKAKSKVLNGADPFSLAHIGGMAIIGVPESSIDIQVELQGVGAPTEYVTNSDGVKLPVYQDSYASSKFSTTDEETGDDYNSDSALYRGPSITFRAGMSLNFKDNATQWNDKVITDLNQDVDLYSPIKPSKVQISLDPTKASDPTSPNATQVRVAKDIGELSNDQIAYIPAYTKAEVTVTYAERLIAYYEI